MPKKVTRPKAEDTQLSDYEMVLIINPGIADEKSDTIVNNLSQFITENGGSISSLERWGKRRLAYPIQHFVEGNYVMTQFKLKPALSKKLEADLEISEEVLRHLMVRLNG